jgi:hypothetical protein
MLRQASQPASQLVSQPASRPPSDAARRRLAAAAQTPARPAVLAGALPRLVILVLTIRPDRIINHNRCERRARAAAAGRAPQGEPSASGRLRLGRRRDCLDLHTSIGRNIAASVAQHRPAASQMRLASCAASSAS